MGVAPHDWHEFANREDLAKGLADKVAELLGAAIARRGAALIAVSGGTTPAPFFRMLSRSDIDWSRVTITLVDERLVPEASPRSNAGLVAANLLQDRAVGASFIGLYSDAASVEDAAEIANARIERLPLPFDAVILGMGTDGHTASFFPDAANLASLLHMDATASVAPVHAQSAQEPRLTLTLPRIAEAAFVALLIDGGDKRRAFEAAIGPGAHVPVRTVLERARLPVQVYWAP